MGGRERPMDRAGDVVGASLGRAVGQPQRRARAQGRPWDLRPIEQLDHIGAQLLWDHWGKAWPARSKWIRSTRRC